MNKTIGQASIRRSGERRPLRLEIARRRAHTAAGAEKFVTEVRIGDASALVVPWREDRVAAPPSNRMAALSPPDRMAALSPPDRVDARRRPNRLVAPRRDDRIAARAA